MNNPLGIADSVLALTRLGLDEAEQIVSDHEDFAWELSDRYDIESRTDNDYGYDQAWDLQNALYGEPVTCFCGCGELRASKVFEDWEWDARESHLAFLYPLE